MSPPSLRHAPLVLLALGALARAQSTTAPANQANQATPAAPTVHVTAKRAAVINEIDRKVYRADADLQASSGSAADLLNNIPSVDVDMDGNLSLRGDAGVTVLIDGKPSGEMQGKNRGAALQSFSAADIQQIEVITSPSAEFKPDGSGGIINIVTKKNRKLGASNTLQANLGNDGRHNATANSSYNSARWHVDGSLGQRSDLRRRSTDNQSDAPGAGGGTGSTGNTLSRQSLDESSQRNFGKASLSYRPNDQQTLGLSIDYARRQEQRLSDEHTFGTASGAGAYDRHGAGGGPRSAGNVGLSVEQKLAGDGEVLSFNLQRGHTIEDNTYDYSTDDSPPAPASSRQRDFNQQVYDIDKFTAAYTRPLTAGATLKLGYDVQAERNGFNNTSASAAPAGAPLGANPALDNHFRYRQNVNALYTTFGRKFDALELLGGLRFEEVSIHTRQNVSGDSAAQRYGKLYPTLNVLYKLSPTETLTAGYSKRVRKPDPEDLNPYINNADPANPRQGNPNLKPETTDALELGYRHEAGAHTYALTAYYRSIHNSYADLLTPLGGGTVLFTKANVPDSRNGGLEFTTSGSLLPTLSYNASGNLFYNQLSTQALGAAGQRSNVALNSKATLNYQPDVDDKWQLSANYRGKRLTPQGYYSPVATLNLGYRRQWSPALALVATVSDLLNSQREKRVYQTSTLQGVYRRHQLGQVVYLGLVYTFGVAGKRSASDFSFE